mgnify:CR=1 FL=1
MNQELMTESEREIFQAIELAQGYWTTAARLIEAEYGLTPTRNPIRVHLLNGTINREQFLDRVQVRINREQAA